MGTINERTGLTTSPVSTGDDSSASSTGTAVGEQADSTGANSAAYGRRARATGQDASAIGAESLAPAQWNSVFGYNAGGVNNGDNVTLLGRNALGTGDNATAVGEMAEALAINATAVGWRASAEADNSLALGAETVASIADAVSIGDRDREIRPGRGLVYAEGSTVEQLADFEVDPDLDAGETVSYELAINGTSFIEVRAGADGSGGIQNPTVFVPQDFTVDGETTEVEDVLTGSVVVEDVNQVAQITLDATMDPPTIDFHGNVAGGLARINPDGTALEIDGDVEISGELSENQTL